MTTDKRNQPPQFALRFLGWVCPPSLLESIEGDLVEKYAEDVKDAGIKQARRRFVISVLSFFRPGIVLRNKFSFRMINTMLLQSYFKISFRNMLRNKGYSSINIFGLAIGISACLITFSFIRFELSFDDFHPDVDRTYRVNQTQIWRPEGGIFGSTGPALAQVLVNDYPEVEEVLRINTAYSYVVRSTDVHGNITAISEDNVLAADSNFFNFFGFRLKEGNPENALKGVNKAVISDKAARKFFGDEPALGKILQLGEDRTPILITGVTLPQPENAHFHFDYLLSIYTNPAIKKFEWSWVWSQVVTYVRLKPGTDKTALEIKLRKLGETRVKPACEAYGIDYDAIVKDKGGWNFYLQPVRDIHLHSAEPGNRLGPMGDITYTLVFGIIGLFVLIIASINFINLSTARGTMRAREVGVKKTLGALRNTLIWQFEIESVLIALMATVLAVIMADALKIILRQTVNINIPITLWTEPKLLWILPVIPIIIGCLAGIYPSFYLTAFRPVQVLKGKLALGLGNSRLRNILVSIQFTISIALIAGTLIIFQQLKFLRTKNLGFDKENVLIVNQAEKLGVHLESFRDELLKYPDVLNAAVAMDVPCRGMYEDIWIMEGSDAKLPMSELKIDHSFFDFMGFELVAGRNFERTRPSDQMAAIPNETAIRLFGLTPQEAIGKNMIYPGDNNAKLEIIGVVKDFNFQSLRQPITPLVLINDHAHIWGDMRVIAVKFRTESISTVMTNIEKKWKESLDATPISFSFLDQVLERQYEEEKQLGSFLQILSGLSIAVAVIGLIGLVAFSVEIRKKEIGIRKVFGASVSRIVMMLNSQYVKLILVALLIASPLSWWIIQKWLNSFAFRIQIHVSVFFIAGMIEMGVALLCVGYLSLRAALLNPAAVLKDE